MAKRNLSAAYNNTGMEDVTKRSLGLAFSDDEEPKDKAPEPKPVIEDAPVTKQEEKKVEKPTQKVAPKPEAKPVTKDTPVAKQEEKKVEKPTQKVAPKPEAKPKKIITRNRVKKLTRPVSLIMDPILFERLEHASEETQRSVNNYISWAVKNQLDKDGY